MPLPRLLVTRPVPTAALELLGSLAEVFVLEGAARTPLPSAEEIARAIPEVELLFTLPAHPITREVISSAPKLRLIATMGTGYDNIDLSAARERGIAVSNAPGILDETTADLTFALLLATARQLPQAERFLRAGAFHGWTPFLFAGAEVHGRTLGIIGLGRIGRAVARRARGFGMRVLYAGRSRNVAAETELGCTQVPLDALLGESDFVSLHVPLTSETRRLIDASALRRMKRTAILINTSRGPVVDEQALAEALRDGVIAGAGLDVFEAEPRVHPALLECENAVLLPHIGSASETTRERMAMRAAENIRAFLQRGAVLDPVG